MVKITKTLVLAAILLFPQTAAYGWDDTGHMVVAHIAFSRLSPIAKAKVNKLLIPLPGKRGLVYFCNRTYDPITIANWMDDIRDSSLHDPYKEWHFINFRPLFAGIPEKSIDPGKVNVLEQIKVSASNLDKLKNFEQTNDRGVDDKASAEWLGFLVHLVGDLHQPLHCCTRYSAQHPDGDFGGNLFSITTTNGPNNLHSFWDAAGGLFNFEKVQRPLGNAGMQRIRMFATNVMNAFPADLNPVWKNMDPKDWVVESNTMAKDFAFTKITVSGTPSAEYIKGARMRAGQRLAFAGYRLAEIINTIYKQP